MTVRAQMVSLDAEIDLSDDSKEENGPSETSSTSRTKKDQAWTVSIISLISHTPVSVLSQR